MDLKPIHSSLWCKRKSVGDQEWEIPHSLIGNSIWKSRYICVLRSTWYISCLADSCSGRWNWESSTRRMDCASQSLWRETTPIPSSSCTHCYSLRTLRLFTTLETPTHVVWPQEWPFRWGIFLPDSPFDISFWAQADTNNPLSRVYATFSSVSH